MAEILTDLAEIKRRAENQDLENMSFRQYVKGDLDWNDRKLDTVVHEVARSVAAQVDCTTCANCCKTMEVRLEPVDVSRLARRLGITAEEFEQRYTRIEDGEMRLNALPCPFLEGNLCSVYEDRPGDCRGFPHLQKRAFRQRTFGIFINADSCPIIYNTLEELKPRTGFSR